MVAAWEMVAVGGVVAAVVGVMVLEVQADGGGCGGGGGAWG